MEKNKEPKKNPIRGKQRIAVYKALNHPVTGKQLLALARQSAPSMTYQDLRHILRDFQRRDLVLCLNPKSQTGRFYVLTSAMKENALSSEQIELCARISRAKTRLAVLEEVAKDHFMDDKPLTATRIKHLLKQRYPLGLNHVLHALKFLEEHGLVKRAGYTNKRELKIYRVTDQGRIILSHVSNPKRAI